MILIIEQVGREWNLRHPNGPRISINDISLKRGGYFDWTQPTPGHHTHHQAGRDADVRYVRNDRTEARCVLALGEDCNPTNPQTKYSQSLTQQLVDLFCEAGVIEIYYNSDAGLTLPPGCLSHPVTSHTDHFHIKIR